MKLEPLGAKTVVADIDKEELTVFLKEIRKKIASYNKIDKLYNVFTNKTLVEIIEKIPRSNEELLLIPGIGKAKVELWGSYLLDQLNKFLVK